jgi:hypothetical protein
MIVIILALNRCLELKQMQLSCLKAQVEVEGLSFVHILWGMSLPESSENLRETVQEDDGGRMVKGVWEEKRCNLKMKPSSNGLGKDRLSL